MTQLAEGERREFPLAPGRQAWVHVARGSVSVNGTSLHEGDGAGVTGEEALRFVGSDTAEILVFDLKQA
jgi:redox-sensitive bicupin YhaK (pirin superfamily)